MEPERWRQIERIFHSALKMPQGERAVFLDQSCAGDQPLRREIESLLAHQNQAVTLFESPALELAVRELQLAEQESSPLGGSAATFTGQLLSHYRVLEKLGGGGMGLVYRAEDIRLGRQVALKFLPEESSKDPAALERFEREARSASALEHPNICPIYEFGEDEGQPFLVMQLLEGQTLRELLFSDGKEKPLELARLVDLAVQIANGLEAAHTHGIIHRDIKPANLFVTAEGQIKILDFGLAKLLQLEMVEQSELPPSTKQSSQGPNASLNLTRSSVVMGTAAYMSPEQVRREQLDVRTDLFSFGAVLYEMATGQPAFSGETITAVLNSILNRMPTPVEELNPEIPHKLQAIISKALAKDRAARYQTVSEMRGDLEVLKQSLNSKYRRMAIAAVALAVLMLAGAILWFTRYQAAQRRGFPQMTQRQLTTTSIENTITASAISSDGKYLAYCDQRGLQVEVVQTGQTRTVAQGEVCRGSSSWSLAWFPDGATLLASELASEWMHIPARGIYSVRVGGGTIHKLRDDADGGSISPNGSLVAFPMNTGDVGRREIWLMGADGSQARKLYETDEQSDFENIRWSPDSRRLIYVKNHWSADASESRLESRDLNGGPPTVIASPAPDDYEWVSDNRIILAQTQDDPSTLCNLWELQIDLRTGQPHGKPRQLTNWAGFSLDNLSATADGKKLAFRRFTDDGTSYVAELSREGTHITTPKRVTMVEGSNSVRAFAPDSNAVIMAATRNGIFGIYRQSLEKDIAAEPIRTGSVANFMYRPSPDHASIFYWVAAKQTIGRRAPVRDLMRVPVAGGPSRLVLSSSPETAWADVRCAKSPAKVCVLLEEGEGDTGETTWTAFDPVKGRDRELFKLGGFTLGRNWQWGWDVSPDGRSVSFIKKNGTISILSLDGRLLKEITPKDWTYIFAFDWAADGKGWFTVGRTGGRQGLLHVDLEGNARLLWPDSGNLEMNWAVPSPDGRRLAIQATAHTFSNIWMIENF